MAPAGSSAKFDTFLANSYMPIEPRVKILLAVLIFLLPVVLFYFLFYSPKQDKLKGLEQQKTTLTTQVKKSKTAARKLKTFQDEVAEAKKRFARTAIVLPGKKEIPDLLRNISDLGKGAGLDFLSFKPGSEIPKEFYAEIPVDISIRGPYHNMGYFLDQISKLDRIVTVNNIKMSSPEKEDGEMVLNSNCRLVTYYFTDTPVSTAGTSAKKAKK